jgi:hypothetical protein
MRALTFCCVAAAHAYITVEDSSFVERDPVSRTVRERDVFFAGINMAWVNFRGDFGSNWGNVVPNATFDAFEGVASQLSAAGGNLIRFWVHCDGATTPSFDAEGNVTGTDTEKWAHTSNRMVGDMRRYLQIAERYNIKILFSLFNFGIQKNPLLGGKLLTDKSVLASYVSSALTPIVHGVKGSEGLLGWEVCNEPEGMMAGIEGAGWSTPTLSVSSVLAFINRIAGAIHDIEPDALVTTGSWSLKVVTSAFPFTQARYSDAQLVAAGGHPKGTLDFYQAHWYEAVGSGAVDPFAHTYAEYKLSKPLLIGEFSQCCSGPLGAATPPVLGAQGPAKSVDQGCTSKGRSIQDMYRHLKSSGFHGGLGWQANDHDGPPNGSGVCGDALATLLEGVKGAGTA